MINLFKMFKKNNKFTFSDRSLQFLSTVHPDLQKLTHKALELCDIQFQVYYGIRTLEEQKKLLASGKSKTLNSRHLHGYAVDVYAEIKKGTADWSTKHYITINNAFIAAAKELKIDYVWGGNWTTFKDYNHFELNKNKYPDKQDVLANLNKIK